MTYIFRYTGGAPEERTRSVIFAHQILDFWEHRKVTIEKKPDGLYIIHNDERWKR